MKKNTPLTGGLGDDDTTGPGSGGNGPLFESLRLSKISTEEAVEVVASAAESWAKTEASWAKGSASGAAFTAMALAPVRSTVAANTASNSVRAPAAVHARVDADDKAYGDMLTRRAQYFKCAKRTPVAGRSTSSPASYGRARGGRRRGGGGRKTTRTCTALTRAADWTPRRTIPSQILRTFQKYYIITLLSDCG